MNKADRSRQTGKMERKGAMSQATDRQERAKKKGGGVTQAWIRKV